MSPLRYAQNITRNGLNYCFHNMASSSTSTVYICWYSATKVAPRRMFHCYRNTAKLSTFHDATCCIRTYLFRLIFVRDTVILFSAIEYDHFMAAMIFCIMATFNQFICVLLVTVATFNADVTACHQWPTKTTIFKKTKLQSTKQTFHLLF